MTASHCFLPTEGNGGCSAFSIHFTQSKVRRGVPYFFPQAENLSGLNWLDWVSDTHRRKGLEGQRALRWELPVFPSSLNYVKFSVFVSPLQLSRWLAFLKKLLWIPQQWKIVRCTWKTLVREHRRKRLSLQCLNSGASESSHVQSAGERANVHTMRELLLKKAEWQMPLCQGQSCKEHSLFFLRIERREQGGDIINPSMRAIVSVLDQEKLCVQ